MPGRKDGTVERDDDVAADLDDRVHPTAGQHPEFQAAASDTRDRLDFLNDFARLRRRMRISQKEIARRMSTTQSAISELEKGIVEPRISTVQRYARILGYRIRLVREPAAPYTNRAVDYPSSLTADVRPSATAWSVEQATTDGTGLPDNDLSISLDNVRYLNFERKADSPLGHSLAVRLNGAAGA
jgi:transcriptional regulator with XRE-family HTH domain